MGQSTSVMNQFVAELRDVNVQKDRMRFRRNLERIGEIQAYEISKQLPYAERVVKTPLGEANMVLPRSAIIRTRLSDRWTFTSNTSSPPT